MTEQLKPSEVLARRFDVGRYSTYRTQAGIPGSEGSLGTSGGSEIVTGFQIFASIEVAERRKAQIQEAIDNMVAIVNGEPLPINPIEPYLTISPAKPDQRAGYSLHRIDADSSRHFIRHFDPSGDFYDRAAEMRDLIGGARFGSNQYAEKNGIAKIIEMERPYER